MDKSFHISIMLFGALLFLSSHAGMAQPRLSYYEEPMQLHEMEEYKDILFDPSHFEKIKNGMSQEDVLKLLGKPLDLEKIKRKKNRWTFHYYYPDGYVVNFRNGLVVGKEKTQ